MTRSVTSNGNNSSDRKAHNKKVYSRNSVQMVLPNSNRNKNGCSHRNDQTGITIQTSNNVPGHKIAIVRHGPNDRISRRRMVVQQIKINGKQTLLVYCFVMI